MSTTKNKTIGMNSTRTQILIVALTVITVAAVAFGIYQYARKNEFKIFMSNSYEKSLHDVAAYVSNVDNMLTKVSVVERPEQSAPMYAEIWKQAASAHENLSSLPYDRSMVSKMLKYLTQVSDFSYGMMIKNMDGKEIEDQDRSNAAKLREYAKILSGELNSTISQADLSGGIKWDILSEENNEDWETGEKVAVLAGSIQTISKQFQEYPSLIYDGPFSDHIQDMKPKMTESMSEITSDEGLEIVWNMLTAYNVADVVLVSESSNENNIPVYSYSAVLNDGTEPELYIDLTKKGGLPLWMLNFTDIPFEDSHISFENALGAAESFLLQCGFENMRHRYYEYSENSIVINFAPLVDEIIYYPDLVKVKVSLSDGQIQGLEALGYINMHTDREISSPALSTDDAINHVSGELSINSVSLAVIPLASYKEELSYEINASGKDSTNFLIYINANTGKMEKIFELMKNENGVLVQ